MMITTSESLHPIVFRAAGRLRFAHDLQSMAKTMDLNIDLSMDRKSIAKAISETAQSQDDEVLARLAAIRIKEEGG